MAILVDCVAYALREVGFQLHGGHRQAIEEEDEIEAVLVLERVAHLPHDTQAVRRVAGEDVGVHRQRGPELRELHGLAQPEQLHTVAEHVERATGIELITQAGEERLAGGGAVVLGEGFPS